MGWQALLVVLPLALSEKPMTQTHGATTGELSVGKF
jgi:hypothetical protein